MTIFWGYRYEEKGSSCQQLLGETRERPLPLESNQKNNPAKDAQTLFSILLRNFIAHDVVTSSSGCSGPVLTDTGGLLESEQETDE